MGSDTEAVWHSTPAVPPPVSPLSGRRVIVTAGGTREPVDPVRYLGNRSSGRMGNAIAIAAAQRGSTVTLVTTVDPPDDARINVVHVETAGEMNAAVRAALPGAALLVMAAAVADYRVAEVGSEKIKKSASLTLQLIPTVDILRSLVGDPIREAVFVVGFAAETDDLDANTARKLVEKQLDLIVLNDISRPDIGMGSVDNEVTMYDSAGVVAHISKRPKSRVATALLEVVEARMRDVGTGPTGLEPSRPPQSR
jgi:phosphopantothenoylcysteine decarboxylase/phosphopantothenate--cysteine ligase